MYSNTKYKVVLPEGGLKYQVINLETDVMEFDSESLPRCIIVAQESESALNRLMPKEEEPARAANVLQLRQDRTE